MGPKYLLEEVGHWAFSLALFLGFWGHNTNCKHAPYPHCCWECSLLSVSVVPQPLQLVLRVAVLLSSVENDDGRGGRRGRGRGAAAGCEIERAGLAWSLHHLP